MTRILRRLFRLAVPSLCLVSLLASCGVAWLWRRSYADNDVIEAIRRHVYVRGDSSQGALYLTRIGEWPEADGIHVRDARPLVIAVQRPYEVRRRCLGVQLNRG